MSRTRGEKNREMFKRSQEKVEMEEKAKNRSGLGRIGQKNRFQSTVQNRLLIGI